MAQAKKGTKKDKVVSLADYYNDMAFDNVYQLLNYLQANIKVENNRNNSFGGFNYHNLKDIYSALKPLLVPIKNATLLPINMEIEESPTGKRYVKATATLHYCNADGEITTVSSVGMAELGEKPKMDASQMTGSASSYAQKYALDTMFLIDDCPTADYWNNGQDEQKPAVNERILGAIEHCKKCGMTDEELDNMKQIAGSDETILLQSLIAYYQEHQKSA